MKQNKMIKLVIKFETCFKNIFVEKAPEKQLPIH